MFDRISDEFSDAKQARGSQDYLQLQGIGVMLTLLTQHMWGAVHC